MNTVDILGIDLGTTKSVIAVWEPDTGARILPNREHEPITPSVVTFDPETGQAVVGQPAIEFMLCHPDDVIYSVKRFIGRTPDDQWVRYDREHVTYPITTDDRHKVVVHAEGRELTPTQVSAEVLRKLKEDAQVSLGGRPITQAVISVPAYFNVSQQRATKEAGELAGLSVPRIVPEPTAAALAFNLGEEPQTVAVYDLGGGTFDISILRVERGLFRVKAIGGDTHLGGDDFDQAIVNWLQNLFEYQHPGVTLPVAQDHRLRARLREAAKQAKVVLTDTSEYAVQLPDLLTVAGQNLGLEATLTREKLEELIRPLIEQSLQLVDKTLAKAGLKKEAIDQILLVGGQTRMPAVKEAIRQRYGRPVNDTVKPEEAVARGAAMLGARLCGYLKEQVALWDVIPLSLGIELADGRMDVIVPANTQIPIEQWRRGPQAFTTQRDGQESIRFKIYQGERPLAVDNIFVGDVLLPLTIARRAGEARVNCLFKIDHSGILTVRAESVDTDSMPVEVNFAYGMSVVEEDAVRQEAEAHRAEDERTSRLLQLQKELAEIRAVNQSRSADDPLFERLSEAETAITAREADEAAHLLEEARQLLVQ